MRRNAQLVVTMLVVGAGAVGASVDGLSGLLFCGGTMLFLCGLVWGIISVLEDGLA